MNDRDLPVLGHQRQAREPAREASGTSAAGPPGSGAGQGGDDPQLNTVFDMSFDDDRAEVEIDLLARVATPSLKRLD